ncbi:MAG: HI0074 family nucleotidyltransferase substrate-binding subunit [Coriobacteriales bacterium]|nr:HI0074 family nucleotidyltransferase substrate-binding subunit [Coriobacteriales bacterium]
MRRYDAYVSALSVLSQAPVQDLQNEFVQSGIVDKFSLQFDLGWKLLKDLLRYEGVASAATGSPREILKASCRYFGFIDEETWLCMLRDRNTIAHVYSGDELRRLIQRVLDTYIPTFQALERAVFEKYGDELERIA